MGQLHDALKVVEQMIQDSGLDPIKTRGQIGMKAGFFLVLITPDSPDDPEQLERLRKAAAEVLGRPVRF